MRALVFTLAFFSSFCLFAQWTQVNNGIANLSLGATALSHSADYLFTGALAGGKMYRSSDYGENWTEIAPPVAGNLPECGHYYSGKYFAGLNASTACIYYSTSNGDSWTEAAGAPATTVVRGFVNLPDVILAFTSSQGIYRSVNGGENWASANNGLTNLNVIWMEVVENRLYAATIGGGVYISDNGGETWVQSNNGINGGDLFGTFVWRMGTNMHYYAQGGGSYISTDGGSNWSTWVKPSVFGLGPNEIYRKGSNLYLEARHFAGGLRDSIYVSKNEGASWENITGNLSATDLNASGIIEFNGYVFIKYNLISPQLGIYRRDGGSVSLSSIPVKSMKVFPNPAKDVLTLSFDIAGDQREFQILNTSGAVLKSGYLSAENRVLDVSDLPAGLYFLRTPAYPEMIIKFIKN